MLISQLPRPPDPGGVGFITCCSRPLVARVLNQDHRIEFATMQPLKSDITLTPHSPWVWHVHHDDERVGTVSGDSVDGFTARDINHRSIGHGYVSAEAAMQAWAGPRDGQPSVTYPPGAFTHVLMPGPPPRPASVGKDGHCGTDQGRAKNGR
jgi:hypothetical protein